ncbi:MAG: hypothetical protein RJA70_1450 [Pseudomonadota bacterium]
MTATTETKGAERERAVAHLQAQLRSRGMRRWRRAAIGLIIVACVGVGARQYWISRQPAPEPRFVAKAAEVRDLVQKVESTGRLKPLTEVQVGAQVSGRVVSVRADFNTQVKQGDLLAEIDPQLFGAQVGQVSGQLKAAEANLERAKATKQSMALTLKRVQSLTAEGIATSAELEQATSGDAVAAAEVLGAEAAIAGLRSQLSSARTTLQYTKIYSPIDGVVILRSVEPGQTVAASLSAPVLFVIAQDLREMQVLAEIDEADVGKLSEGMSASVRVDAFVGRDFAGKVTQVRYSPNEVQGVVTYSAVIDVTNPALELRPGMTATVAITTREEKQVLAVPNAALRFKPEKPEEIASTPPGPTEGRLYRVSGGAVGQETLAAEVVTLGISDGLWTRVQGGKVAPDSQWVTDQKDRKQERSKFMGIF